MHQTRGFSLIELMIVVAIIGILATLAVPSYQQYTKKARFAEIITTASIFKTAVALAIQEGVPLDEIKDGTHGLPPSPPATKNLAGIKVARGVITATATDVIDKASYILKPSQDGSIWAVGGTCLKSGLCND